MSKITFRADDDLVRRIESYDASKSEIMREALREYLDAEETVGAGDATESADRPLDELLASRVDELVEERLARERADDQQGVNVNVTLESPDQRPARARQRSTGGRSPPEPDAVETSCGQCGEPVDDDHVYCPNCGEKAAHRIFCECGDELRSDWAFCPGCGRRTPSADVLESS